VSSGVIGVVLAGVAPQPVEATARLLAEAALAAGLDVSCAEHPPPLPRGGAVSAHVRMGPEVHSPLVREGAADVLVAFDRVEALRAARLLARGGFALVDDALVPTWRMRAGLDAPPDDVLARLGEVTGRVVSVRASALAPPGADAAVAGVALLGVVSRLLPIPAEAFEAALAAGGSALGAARRQAFAAGRELFDTLPARVTGGRGPDPA
jgi:indolepyruvate ferredoxin oxidoreductase, beta subunit